MILTKNVSGLSRGFERKAEFTKPASAPAVIKRTLMTSVVLLVFAIGVRAQGTFVYTNDDGFFANTVSGFAVGANGALTQIAGSPFSTGGSGGVGGLFASNRVAISTAGRFLYAGNTRSSTISGFSINPVTGFLTPVPGSPFPAGGFTDEGYSMAVTPDSKFLYCGNSLSDTISGFAIAGNGSLTPLGSSPFPSGFQIDGMRMSPNGKFLAVALEFVTAGG